MAEHDDSSGHLAREQTDESLRVERDKADALVEAKHEATESRADQEVERAREHADQLLRTVRVDADHERADLAPSAKAEASAERERAQVDLVLEHERAKADTALQRERAQRKRTLADFLAVEREATNADLTDEREHADAVVAVRDEFLATVSHDLRSLLNGISLNNCLLLEQAVDGAVGDHVRKHAATAERLVARMNRMINDLLDISSIEAGKLALVAEQVELATLANDTLEAFDPVALAKGVVLATEIANAPQRACLDSGRILQVLANLVSNAIKFTPAGGTITIRIQGAAGEIHFAVSDTGIGIPADALAGVFERFRQVSRDRRGLGLGLHISRCIVEAHGGRMWAESKLAVGSTFYFALPATA